MLAKDFPNSVFRYTATQSLQYNGHDLYSHV